nr:hypothetical protein [Tanacetum cinerariifolium]
MARLAFCDYHNMIAILEKYEHNTDFHQIVDFVEASHLRYALTINPTVYVSHIRQFWSTARIETTDEGTKILATVDGKLRTIFESSIRRNLKLRDEARISSLPDVELFKNLTLMGYNILPNQKFSFQKGEGSGTPTEPHHTPSREAQQTSPTATSSASLPPVTTATIPAVIPTVTPQLRHYTRRARIDQSSALLTITDEPASPIRDDSQGEACPTIFGLEAEQDRANITKTSTLPSDSTPRVTSLAADEGTQDLEISQLKARVKLLEDRDGGASMLTSGVSVSLSPVTEVSVAKVPTVSGYIPTASPHVTRVPTGSVVPTASLIFTTATVATLYSRKKEEEMERDAQRMNEQIARDAKITRIHAEEELQIMIDGLDRNSETVAKHFKGITLEEIKEKFDPVWKQIEDFIPIGSKEEGERFKRKGLKLKQDSAKKVKTSEEVSEEDLKTMMQLVPVEEVYVEALQVKHPIINWEIQTEGQRSYWKIMRLEGITASYQFFVDMLKHFDREDLNQLWALVKETLNIRQATMEWKLYDSCGVHHVLSGNQEIFMLVEKDYPLRKGLAIVMISNKLHVENYSQMANDLILKIH